LLLYRRLLNAWIVHAGHDHASPAFQMAAIHYKLVIGLAQACFDWRTLRAARDAGCAFVAGKAPTPIDQAMEQLKLDAVPKVDFQLSWSEGLREWLRVVRCNPGAGKAVRALARQFRPGGASAVGDPAKKELEPYMAAAPEPLLWLRPSLFFQGGAAQAAVSGPVEAFATAFGKVLTGECPEFFDNDMLARLRDCLLRTAAAWDAARQSLRGRHLGELLLTHMGNLQHRVLGSAWKSAGGATVGVVHGYPYPYSYSDGEPVVGARLVFSKYLVMSKGEKRLLECSRRDFPTGFESDDEVVVCGGDVYRRMFDRCQALPPASGPVKSVMLVGFPMDYLRSITLPEMDTMTYLAFELDILAALKQLGHEVIYKAHPDTLERTKALFQGRVDRIETRPFEQTLALADCVLFSHPFTTTFGHALMSRRPLALMSGGGPDGYRWHPEVLPLLRRRVALVETNPGPAGIGFSPQDLAEALRQAPALMDDALVRQFAL